MMRASGGVSRGRGGGGLGSVLWASALAVTCSSPLPSTSALSGSDDTLFTRMVTLFSVSRLRRSLILDAVGERWGTGGGRDGGREGCRRYILMILEISKMLNRLGERKKERKKDVWEGQYRKQNKTNN